MNSNRHSRLPLALAAALLAPSALLAHAQTSFGTITGTVMDPAGAIVPDAQISIRNVGTSLTRTLKSDSAGNYNAPSLPPGQYVVSVEHAGFSKQVGNPLNLDAEQVARVDFNLTIGGLDQVVTVDTSVAQLQTDNPGVGTTIDNKKSWTSP